MDKYLPVQVHREITHYLQFVIGKNDEFRNRLQWYDEIKTPLLTSLILVDSGREALEERT